LNERWQSWCAERGIAADDIALIASRMAELNDTIAADRTLGEQYRVGHSYVTPQAASPPADARAWFREVVETEIGPLLDEYWFDAPNKARDARVALLRDS
jgi:5-methylcytosine-specific restriction protein B